MSSARCSGSVGGAIVALLIVLKGPVARSQQPSAKLSLVAVRGVAVFPHVGVPLFASVYYSLARPSCQAFSSRQKLCVLRSVRLNRFGQDLRLGPSERRSKIRQQAVHTGREVRGQHFGRVKMSRSAASPFRAAGPVGLHPPTSVAE